MTMRTPEHMTIAKMTKDIESAIPNLKVRYDAATMQYVFSDGFVSFRTDFHSLHQSIVPFSEIVSTIYVEMENQRTELGIELWNVNYRRFFHQFIVNKRTVEC